MKNKKTVKHPAASRRAFPGRPESSPWPALGHRRAGWRRRVKSKTSPATGLTLLRRSIQRYPHDPSKAKLETFPNPYPLRDYWIHFECPEFTTLCPITGQPDFAIITIDYIPDKLCLESKTLKFYLFSYRNIGAFHETSVNRILEDIVKACRPRRLKVNGKFNPRGGISITVSTEYP